MGAHSGRPDVVRRLLAYQAGAAVGGWVPEAPSAGSRDAGRTADPDPDPVTDRDPDRYASPAADPDPAADRNADAAAESDLGSDADPDPDPDADLGPDPGPGAGPGGWAARRARRRWGRLAERWVPEPLRDSRVDPGRRGAVLLTTVAALAAVIAAIGVWRDRPEPRPVQAFAMAPATATIGLASGAPAAVASTSASPPTAHSKTPEPTEIVVSVTGLVKHPGLVRLSPGARVADAIQAAGGAASGADLTGVNLAARLTDGDSIVLTEHPAATPSSPPARALPTGGSDGDAEAAPALVNLNTADAAELERLPGVGPVMAAAIVAWRAKNGAFTSVDQLRQVDGIGPTRFARLAPLVTL